MLIPASPRGSTTGAAIAATSASTTRWPAPTTCPRPRSSPRTEAGSSQARRNSAWPWRHHPASLPQIPAAGVTYDYWMFEGLRDSGNPELHVTSTGCDDGVAVSLCAGSLNALAVHGFLPRPPGMS